MKQPVKDSGELEEKKSNTRKSHNTRTLRGGVKGVGGTTGRAKIHLVGDESTSLCLSTHVRLRFVRVRPKVDFYTDL
jgi:hypothetical protein